MCQALQESFDIRFISTAIAWGKRGTAEKRLDCDSHRRQSWDLLQGTCSWNRLTWSSMGMLPLTASPCPAPGLVLKGNPVLSTRLTCLALSRFGTWNPDLGTTLQITSTKPNRGAMGDPERECGFPEVTQNQDLKLDLPTQLSTLSTSLNEHFTLNKM